MFVSTNRKSRLTFLPPVLFLFFHIFIITYFVRLFLQDRPEGEPLLETPGQMSNVGRIFERCVEMVVFRNSL